MIDSTDTRGAAGEAIGPHLDRLQQAVLGFIRGRGDRGATDQELAAGLELQSDTTRARRVELRDAGLVCDSGRRRPTSTGRAATVWIAAGRDRQRTLDELTASVASPDRRFAGWVRRADVRGRMGWEAPAVPERLRWWARADWEDLPSPREDRTAAFGDEDVTAGPAD
ncbi:MAG TPA: hypothetical protein VMY42_09545 [Thermoguttaceae bacterium]|nr:hypothetical protein [Thermoguttaceae bacterium]